MPADTPYYLRLTGLTPLASQALEAAFLQTPPATWTLADHEFTVSHVCCNAEEEPWSGCTTYETLAAARSYYNLPSLRGVLLLFHSPTAFQSKEMHVPVPLPNLVFGSLVDRWNAFSPVTLSPEVRRFGEEMVAGATTHWKARSYRKKAARLLIWRRRPRHLHRAGRRPLLAGHHADVGRFCLVQWRWRQDDNWHGAGAAG